MPILAFLSSLFTPLTDIVTNLHTSDADKMTLQNKLVELQNQVSLKVLDYESKLLAAQSDVIKAEANGSSWLQRTWRPITMIVFLILVVCDSFGWLKNPLAPQAWTLLQLGMGGYIASRGLEKIVPGITDAIKQTKQ